MISICGELCSCPGKFHALYWSLIPHGQQGLTREDLWFTCCILRSNLASQLNGGLSLLTKHVVSLFEPLKTGLVLSAGDQSFFFFGQVSVLLGDEAALKAMWNVKGASGTVPCIFCWNIVAARSGLPEVDSTGNLVPHTCTDVSKLKLRSDADFAGAAQMLVRERPLRTVGNFKTLEQSLGVNYDPEGMLFDPNCPLKPVSSTMYDWLHCYLVNGIFQTEVNLFLPALVRAVGNHGVVVQYLRSFNAPAEYRSNLKGAIDAFEKSRTKDGWKPSASEALCVYPILRVLTLETAFQDDGQKLMASCFMLLCRVLDLLSCIGKDMAVDVDQLEGLIVRHLDSFKGSYGSDDMVPKHHYVLHLMPLLRRHGQLISCFTHERKHKSLKLFANQISNAGSWFEKSVLREVTHSSMISLQNFTPSGVWLVNGREGNRMKLRDADLGFLRAIPDVMVATHACIHGLHAHRGDVCMLKIGTGQVGYVHAHVALGEQHMSLVTVWRQLGRNQFGTNDAARWIESSQLNLCEATSIFSFLWLSRTR